MQRHQDINWTEFKKNLENQSEEQLQLNLNILSKECIVARQLEIETRDKYRDALSTRIGSEMKAEKVAYKLEMLRRAKQN